MNLSRHVFSLTGLDEPKDPLSYQQSEIFQVINFGFLCTIICLMGIVSNIINIVIFTNQGYKTTMNIGLCGLAVCDLLCLVAQLWVNISFYPILRKADIPFVSEEVQYLTGIVPYVSCIRISGWITMSITFERCLSIAVPLKVKELITPSRTAVIVCSIYIVNIVSVTSEYFTYHLTWKFYPIRNKTLYGIVLHVPNFYTGIITYALHILLGSMSYIGVIVCTIILTVTLNRKSSWRKTVTSDQKMSNRDRKTVKMIAAIATIFIACNTPATVVALGMICEPNLSLLGPYSNTFFAVASVACVPQNINSSVNIVLYYRMSSKYRETFQVLFCAKSQRKEKNETA